MTSKEKVLEFLETNREGYTSGEVMANALGLSRNAIWKAINELKKGGYRIDAVSHKGYRLSGKNDILSVVSILAGLEGKAAMLYQKHPDRIHICDTLDSTNRRAKEFAIAEAGHGTVVLANEQTNGRGRSDHSFFSPRGGLYMSIVMTPEHLKSTNADEITAFTGNSVCDAIAALTPVIPRLKPVNDIFVGEKKICGILTEAGTEFETGLLRWIVVGIGINFDSDIQSFPKEIRDSATALFPPNGASVTRNQLAAAILNRILAE